MINQIRALESPYFEKGVALPANALEQRRALRDKLDAIGKSEKPYYSSHWDEKNILAHIRFNERTDAGGKRVLFIEEIQSDWQQAYRDGKTDIKGPFITDTKETVSLAMKRMMAPSI